MSSSTSHESGHVMDHGGGGFTHVAHEHHRGFANPNPVPGGPVPPQRGTFANPANPGPRPVREPATPPAAGSASANANPPHGPANPGPQQAASASERTTPHMHPVSKPANPGATWSPGPAPRFANAPAAQPVPPESPAETTSPIPRVRDASAFANSNPSAPGGVSPGGFANLPAGPPPAAPGVREPANPLVRKPSLWALLGFTEDARLIEAGYVGVRKPGHPLTWMYEPQGQAARRQERRRREHDLRMRNREFARRVDSFKLAIAPRLGLEWFDVDITVPVEYDDKSVRTGDVIVERGVTRLREASDPADMPEVKPVRLVLPDGFHPETKALVTGLIKEYFGGEWGSRFNVTAHPHFAEFWREREKPAPPRTIPDRTIDKISDDPYSLYVGHDGVNDVYIQLQTDAPHVGISAGSGKGKTSTLLAVLQHARRHGIVVDIIDLKEDSFDKAAATPEKNRFNVDVFKDVSGVRVHRDVRSAVAALAEYYVSAKSLRMAREGGYNMSTVPQRYLIIDEFGSFMQVAKNYWDLLKMRFKAADQEYPGSPPFHSWFHQILMQGRSKDHRVFIGTHDYDERTFGGTGVRQLIGAKILIRDNLPNSFIKAFGQGTKRIKINEAIKGRAMIQMMPGAPVSELQLAYTPEVECLEFLLGLPPAPEWFDQGRMAPWISPASIARSHEEAFVEPFVETGLMITPGDPEAGGTVGSGSPMQGGEAASGLRVALTDSELREREDVEVLTQREILDRGYLMPLVREAEARQPGRTPDELLKAALKVMRNDRDRGKFPEAVGEGTKGKLYRVGDVREWERNRPNKMEFDATTGDNSGDDSGESVSETRGA